MDGKERRNKSIPQLPPGIAEALRGNGITATPFEGKNDILTDAKLQKEVGYTRMADGTYLVSMTCPMPGITPEMIEWWFWWHPQADERYQLWFPGEHFAISYDKRDRNYFRRDTRPAFQRNTQYPTERIGEMKMPLRIDFVTPEEFGFSKDLMEKNEIPLMVCGHVGAFRGLIRHTEMAHIFQKTDDGLLLISRFWVGQTLKAPFLRKRILTEQTARGMAEHCCIEYRNLAELLPALYAREHS